MLSDRSIQQAIVDGRIRIKPNRPEKIQPASIDLHLGPRLRVFAAANISHIDSRHPDASLTTEVEMPEGDQPYILHPGEFLLGSTVEVLQLADDLVARIEGKSSLGRIGLVIHATAGFVDPGFRGDLTLEISNVARLPIALYRNMPIGQIAFMELTTPVRRPYGHPELGSHYQDQAGPTPSRQ